MFKNLFSLKTFGLLVLISIAFTGCSPKVKLGLWVKKHQDAAVALGMWGANHPDEATALFGLDCSDRQQFKKKITNALNNAPAQQTAQQGYDVRQHNYHYGTAPARGNEDGFANWCRQYPRAAKRLRSHAKAICKAGYVALNSIIK